MHRVTFYGRGVRLALFSRSARVRFWIDASASGEPTERGREEISWGESVSDSGHLSFTDSTGEAIPSVESADVSFAMLDPPREEAILCGESAETTGSTTGYSPEVIEVAEVVNDAAQIANNTSEALVEPILSMEVRADLVAWGVLGAEAVVPTEATTSQMVGAPDLRAELLGVEEAWFTYQNARITAAETISVTEVVDDAISAPLDETAEMLAFVEGRFDILLAPIGGPLVETEIDSLGLPAYVAEALSVNEARTSAGGAREGRAEALSIGEDRIDTFYSTNDFGAVWAAMPKPATPGGFPLYLAGAWTWVTPQQMLQRMESGTEQPGFWINTAGVY